jgi:hypothetical protein
MVEAVIEVGDYEEPEADKTASGWEKKSGSEGKNTMA